MRLSKRIGLAASTLAGVPQLESRLKETQTVLLDAISTLESHLTSIQSRIEQLERKYENHRRTMDWYASTGAIAIQKTTLETMRLLQPCRARSFEKVRLGSKHDGGYVCLDDFAGLDAAFSFGIESNADWDVDAASRGLTVYQFDHTIDRQPVEHPKLVWEKVMIASKAGPGQESITSLVTRHDKGALRPNLLLKMDIEGSEWPVINATPSKVLGRFAQIICELHSFDYLGEQWQQHRVFESLSRLNEHYRVVHVHANNNCGFANVSGVVVPMILEVTFANRSVYEFEPTAELFPGPLDAPCDPWRPDLHLGTFRY